MADDAGVVGFIGLGIMGKPMARNLLGAGFDLVVHSRSPGAGGRGGRGRRAAGVVAAEVAGACDTLITMLPDTPDVEAVLFGDTGAAGALRPGALAIDMSTISPIATRAMSARLRESGVGFLDAPVSGGEKGAIEGTLSIMIGGASAGRRARAAAVPERWERPSCTSATPAPARSRRRATSWWSRPLSRPSPRR